MVCSDNSNALVDMHLTIFWGAFRAVPGPCLPGLPLAINYLQKTFLYINTGYAEFFWMPKLESPHIRRHSSVGWNLPKRPSFRRPGSPTGNLLAVGVGRLASPYKSSGRASHHSWGVSPKINNKLKDRALEGRHTSAEHDRAHAHSPAV